LGIYSMGSRALGVFGVALDWTSTRVPAGSQETG
jgi:hypothetical protein